MHVCVLVLCNTRIVYITNVLPAVADLYILVTYDNIELRLFNEPHCTT